jgi:hypothetical protein
MNALILSEKTLTHEKQALTIIYIVLSPIIYTRITRIVRFHISIGKLED